MKIHVPDITGSFDLLNDLVGTGNISSSITSTGSFGRVEATSFSGDGSGLSNLPASYTSAEISGSWLGQNVLSGSALEGTRTIISGSSISTGSFGRVEAIGTGSFAGLIIGGGVFTSASIAGSGGGGTITALNNATANELVTVGATTTELDAEANLTFDGSTLTVTGDATVTGDITIDDGGSLKEAGGTAAITFDGSGHVTKIGQDSPSDDEVLTWDGSKWVASSVPDATVTGGTGLNATGTTMGGVVSKEAGTLTASFSDTITINSSSLHIASASLITDNISRPSIDISKSSKEGVGTDENYYYSNYGIPGNINITAPEGMYFSDDGRYFYIIVGSSSSRILYGFEMKKPWDITTLLYFTYFGIGSPDTYASCVTFSPDGMKMFIGSTGTDGISQFNLTSSFHAKSATREKTVDLNIVGDGSGPDENSPTGLVWHPRGKKLYVTGTNIDAVIEYHVTGSSETFDIGSLKFNKQFSISNEETDAHGLAFSPNGNHMFVSGDQADEVNQYHLSRSWDVGTAAFVSKFDFTTPENSPDAFFLKPDLSRFYVAGSGDDAINEFYITGSNPTLIDADLEFKANNVSFEKSSNIHVSGTLNVDTAYPVKFNQTLNMQSSSIEASIINQPIQWNTIDFVKSSDDAGYTNNYGLDGNITHNDPCGMYFKPDGTKLWVLDGSSSARNLYSFFLTKPWDIHTQKYDSQVSISNHPKGLWVDPEGKRFWITTTTSVREYTTDSPWQPKDINNTKTIDLGDVPSFKGTAFNEDAAMDLHWKPDGTKLYIAGQTNDAILQYAVTGSEVFDINSLYCEKILYVPHQQVSLTALTFSHDGSQLIAIGETNDVLYIWDLSKSWDISTAVANKANDTDSQHGHGLYIGNYDSQPRSMFLKPDNSGFYISGRGDDAINELSFSPYGSSKSGSYINYSGSRDITISAGTTNVYGDLDTKGKLILQSSPEFKTKANIESGFNAGTGSVFVSSITNQFDISKFKHVKSSDEAGYTSNYAFPGNNSLTALRSMFFKPDGTKLWVVDGSSSSRYIYEFAVTTPWDIFSLVYIYREYVTSDGTNVEDIHFSEDGTKFLTLSLSEDGPVLYDLSEPWNLKSRVLNKKVNIGSAPTNAVNEDDPYSFYFKPGGFKMYVAGATTDSVLQYDITGSAYDIGSLKYEKSFDIQYQESSVRTLTFTNDGSHMFLAGITKDTIYQYDLDVSWDVSTARRTDSLNIFTPENAVYDITWNPNYERFYIVGTGDDAINEFQYNLTGSHQQPDSITIGTSTDIHGDLDVKGKLILQQPNNIDFTSPLKLDHGVNSATGSNFINYLSSNFNVSNFNFTQVSSDPGTIGDILDIWFRPDGKMVYLQDDYGVDKIFQYTLSTAWDISTLNTTKLREFSVSSEESNIYGSHMTHDGRRLFIVGSGEDGINSYELTGSWDINTATPVKAVNIGLVDNAVNEDNPQAIYCSPDGRHFYVAGTDQDGIMQYAVTGSAFDIGSLRYEGVHREPYSGTAITGISFTDDGMSMFVVGTNVDRIYQFDLEKAWNILTARLIDYKYVGGEESGPNGFYITPDRSRMYVTGVTGHDINEYHYGDTGSADFTNTFSTGSSDALNIGGQVNLFGSVNVSQDITALGYISQSYYATASFGHTMATSFAGDGASLTNVPDYVYEPTYELKSINELEEFVTENKHLPNVPDMTDMVKWKTLSVGDRDMLLLEKIEELSLYIIQLNKRIKDLENK